MKVSVKIDLHEPKMFKLSELVAASNPKIKPGKVVSLVGVKQVSIQGRVIDDVATLGQHHLNGNVWHYKLTQGPLFIAKVRINKVDDVVSVWLPEATVQQGWDVVIDFDYQED